MYFDLSAEQRLFHSTVRSYVSAKHPVSGTLKLAETGEHRFDAAWAGLHELGLGGLLVSEDHGGSGSSVLDAAVAAQALGEGAAPGSLVDNWLTGYALDAWGSAEQRRRWAPGLADGSVRTGVTWNDGRPVVGARHADVVLDVRADAITVSTRDDVRAEPLPGIDLTRPIDAVAVLGSGDPLPAAGPEEIRRLRAIGHVLIAADAFGAGLQGLTASVAYAKVRRQGGRLIGEYQAVKHQLADLALLLEPSRALYWYAAHAIDSDRSNAHESAALAKSHITARAVEVLRRSIELHGGFGYTWECDLHVYLKRALLDRELLGDPVTLQDELADTLYGPISRRDRRCACS